ncbi:MAG: (S)-ureidoglycine aminohydrolase [Planctomycetota bacterium]
MTSPPIRRSPLGETRTSVQSDHALVGTDSHVPSPLFGWNDTSGVMLISPAMASATGAGARRGPGFAMYLASLSEHSSTRAAPAGIQRCCYVLEGAISLDAQPLTVGSYAYLPADSEYDLRGQADLAQLLVFEKRYVPLPGVQRPGAMVGDVHHLTAEPFLGDPDAMLANLLPDDSAFDMAVNIFTYESGAALPFVETHIMEHGLFMTSGQGVYRLSDCWYPVAQGDAIWMAAYCPQWFVAMGGKPAQYIYYKDVNRFHLPPAIDQP